MNNKGFTLIEVLAVVAIIAIIGMIAMPSVLSILNSSKDNSYKIMIDNIRTAAGEMYQEKDYLNTNIYHFDNNGRCTDVDENEKCTDITKMVKIESNSITVNLQTLVGNGYLTGSTNNDLSVNKNKKIILNPKTNEDLGTCKIKITKISGDKTCYKIEDANNSDIEYPESCPTISDFGGNNQCS